MNLNEINPDLILRYRYIHRHRMTDAQKERFLNSLIKDVVSVRNDVKVIESKRKNQISSLSKNIYIGDVKKADLIIATYYDTQASHIGSFVFDDLERQKNKTLLFNLISSLILIAVGLLYTLFVTMPYLNYFITLGNWGAVLLNILIYFFLIISISKMARGVPMRKTWIRNTSTVLSLINHVLTSPVSPFIAYAFVDNGTTTEQGLDSLLASVKTNSKVIYLDSLGAEPGLVLKNQEGIQKFNRNLKMAPGLSRIYPGLSRNKLTRKQLSNNKVEEEHFRLVFSHLCNELREVKSDV